MNQSTETQPPSQPINYIHSVHEALKHRQTEISYPYLMGVSGEAFRLFYNRFEPEKGMNTFLHNPLRAVCNALGFKHELLYDEIYETAWERLCENGRSEKLILLPFSDCCPLLISADEPETIICQNGSRYKLSFKELQTQWQPIGGFLELGPYGYYQFVLGDPEREPKEREAALGAFRCASKLMRSRRKIDNCALGLAAYEELISHLSGMIVSKRKLTESEIEKAIKWNGRPLLQCLEARKVAVEYLLLVEDHFDGEEAEHLKKARAAYKKVVVLLRKLRTVWSSALFLSEPPETLADQQPHRIGLNSSMILAWKADQIADKQAKLRQEVMKQFKSNCRDAIKLLIKIADVEAVAIGELENVVRVSEKVKM